MESTVQSFGFGNSFRRPATAEEMRVHAKRLHERADALVSSSWNRTTSVPSVLVTGSVKYGKLFGKQNERNMRAFENAGAKAKLLRQAAEKWIARANKIDPAQIAAKAKTKEATATAKAAIADFFRDTIKPGDEIFIGGNNTVVVKRVNRKSITSESGTIWTFDEMSTHKTTAEFMHAYKLWKNLNE